MRVLHINNVANVADTLVRDLCRRGIEADLYQPSTGGAHLGPLQRGIKLLSRMVQILAILIRTWTGRYEIVHIHYGYYGLIGMLGFRPYILHCHGTDVRRNLYKHPYKVPTLWAIKNAHKVYFSTPDLAEHVHKVRPDAEFLPNPIDPCVFDLGEPKSVGRAHNEPHEVLILSRLEPIKGTGIAIVAAKDAQQQQSISITIKAFDWGVEAAKYRTDVDIELIPLQPYENMPEILASADMCIGQLHLGIISMTELEAMCSRKPVIMYFKHRQAYEQFPPVMNVDPNVNDVSRAIVKLAQDPQLGIELGNKAREWVISNHHVKIINDRLMLEYQRMIDGIRREN